ncbi:MAG: hypothetical protein P8188_12460 [Gemmatimonadota bacterium]|jgi:hypothetical protein
MSEYDDTLKKILAKLEEERDELKLKFGLAKLESREEWQDVSRKLERLRGRAKVVQDEAGESSGDVGAALEILGDELKAALNRIREVL